MNLEKEVNSQSRDVLIVFVRNPELGKVKTRLAKSIGSQQALEVYLQLLEHTRWVTDRLLEVTKVVYYADTVPTRDAWNDAVYEKRLQRGDNLGERMQNAFADCLEEGADKVFIIGSDCPDIQLEHLRAAISYLGNADVVVGPATDGGYYLLGMKALHPELFKEISWSTPAVFAQTRQKLENLDLSYCLLEVLSDVDELESYERMKEKLENNRTKVR